MVGVPLRLSNNNNNNNNNLLSIIANKIRRIQQLYMYICVQSRNTYVHV